MNKNYELHEVEPIESVKDLMQKATKEAGSKIAFMYKDGKNDVEVTYNQFQEDTIAIGTALADMDMQDKHI